VKEKFMKGPVILHRVNEKFMKGLVLAEIPLCEKKEREGAP
jgi:hypothetical protein